MWHSQEQVRQIQRQADDDQAALQAQNTATLSRVRADSMAESAALQSEIDRLRVLLKAAQGSASTSMQDAQAAAEAAIKVRDSLFLRVCWRVLSVSARFAEVVRISI